MFTIIHKIISNDSAKCVGYYVKNLDNGIEGAVSRDMIVALVTCSLIEDITLDVTGRLTGINGFKVSSIKSRVMYLKEDEDLKDMDYFSWTGAEPVKTKNDYQDILKDRVNTPINPECDTVEKPQIKKHKILEKSHHVSVKARMKEYEEKERETKGIQKGTQKGFQNVEIRSVGYDEKTGHCHVIVRASSILYSKDFKNIAIKSKREKGGITFSANLKSFVYKLEDMCLERHQLITTKRTLVFLKRCMASAKERKVTGVDMFNIVLPSTYTDLSEFYLYLCKNAIYIEDEEVKWLHDSQNIDK